MNIFERIKKGELKQSEAAQLLKISERQVRRRWKNYCIEGTKSLAHKLRGKRSNRKISDIVRSKIISLLKDKYLSLRDKPGPTFLADQLEKNDQIKINHETLRRLMIEEDLWAVLKKKKKRQHQWRERKHHFGEMVQIDGSLHIWFGDEYATLIAFIDDATGRIVWGEFTHRESTIDLGRMTRDYIKQYGRPLSLYSDRGSTYKVNTAKDVTRHKTHYERMLKEVDIELIHARSPQAKGRIERLFKTLQDRLCKELQLAGITTRDAANVFLKNVYIPEHNAKFAVEPQAKADFHRSIEGFELHSIFCFKFERIINNDYTIQFKDQWFQLERSQPVMLRGGNKVIVYRAFDGTIDLGYRGYRLAFRPITKQKPEAKKKDDRPGKRLRNYKPSASHPWKQTDRTFLKSYK